VEIHLDKMKIHLADANIMIDVAILPKNEGVKL
jgi:hypothetical protein